MRRKATEGHHPPGRRSARPGEEDVTRAAIPPHGSREHRAATGAKTARPPTPNRWHSLNALCGPEKWEPLMTPSVARALARANPDAPTGGMEFAAEGAR